MLHREIQKICIFSKLQLNIIPRNIYVIDNQCFICLLQKKEMSVVTFFQTNIRPDM